MLAALEVAVEADVDALLRRGRVDAQNFETLLQTVHRRALATAARVVQAGSERFRAAAGVARRLATGARYRLRGDAEGLVTDGLLEGLEILRCGPPRSDERIDFALDRGYDRGAPTCWGR